MKKSLDFGRKTKLIGKRGAVKLLCLILALVMSVGIFGGCSSLSGDDKGAIISMYLTSFPTSLDPSAFQIDADNIKLLGLMYETLTLLDEDGKVNKGLAENWYTKYDEKDERYKMYFEIKSTKWSDGRNVSADDVVYAWKRILNPKSQSPYASLLFPILNAKAVKAGNVSTDALGLSALDASLLEIVFEDEYAKDNLEVAKQLFLETVSSIALTPLREDIVLRVGTTKAWHIDASVAVCNGPFKLQTYDTDKGRIVLERNSYYMRDDEKEEALDKYVLPYRLTCSLKSLKDYEERGLELQSKRFADGDIYYLSAFNAATYPNHSADCEKMQALSSYVYYFNTSNSIFANAQVRYALSMALDRNRIAEIAGAGQVAATGFVPSGVFETAFDNDKDFREVGGNLYGNAADVEGAKSLLSQAGVTSGSFTLKYRSVGNGQIDTEKNKAVAEYAKEVWDSMGFNVTLEGLADTKYLEAFNTGNFDVIGLDYAINSVDAFGYIAPFARYYSGNTVSIAVGENDYTPHITGFYDADFEALIDSAVYVSDRSKRAEILHQAEAKLVELCPATALYFNVNSYVANEKLSKLEKSYYGYSIFTNAKLSGYKKINSEENAASEAAAAAAAG